MLEIVFTIQLPLIPSIIISSTPKSQPNHNHTQIEQNTSPEENNRFKNFNVRTDRIFEKQHNALFWSESYPLELGRVANDLLINLLYCELYLVREL